MTNTVPMNAHGMIGEMTFFQIRYTPPMSSASALTSPTEPPMKPRNISMLDGSFAPAPPSARIPSGVAPVVASVVSAILGSGHVDMFAAKEMNRKILAVIAGFTKFFPIPP